MRITDLCGLAALAAGCAALLTLDASGQASRRVGQDDTPKEALERAAALFESSCSTCHLPPDPDHATDRAWLTQVSDTA